jgi:hypothetical protein
VKACYSECSSDKRSEVRECFLLPWLNLDTLQKDPFKLFALLYGRTEFNPEDWVIFDREQTKIGWWSGRLEVDYAKCCVVLHGPNYGEICTWDTDKIKRGDIFGFPRARLILEAQSTLMGFLRKTVEILLQGVTGSTPTSSSKWLEMAASDFRRCAGDEPWSRLTDQPYFRPLFDWSRVLDIARSQLAEANDWLWLLQTDAAYFQNYMTQICCGDVLFGVDPKKHDGKPCENLARQLWDRLTFQSFSWQEIVSELEYAKSTFDYYSSEIKLGGRLPPVFDFAMGCLERCLLGETETRINILQNILPRLPDFRKKFVGVPVPNTSHISLALVVHPSDNNDLFSNECRDLFREDPFFWCLHNLYHDFERDPLADPAILFGLLNGRLAAGDSVGKKDKARVSQALLNELSSLAAIHEILAAVRQFRPGFESVSTEEALEKCGERYAWRVYCSNGNARYPPRPFFLKMAKSLHTFTSMPFPKGPRDDEWLQRADAVRENSRAFWEVVREMHSWLMKTAPYQKLTEADRKERLALLSFDSIPTYLETLKIERARILSQKKPVKPSEPSLSSSFNDSPSMQALNTSSDLLPTRPKEKLKTRRTSSTIDPTVPAVEPATAERISTVREAPLQKKIHVKSETVRVLSRMFPATCEEHVAKPLDWRSFSVAMEDAGFLASQSGGSAVTFSKEGEGRIVFHKPHPIAKIDQIDLQWWGKRMNKWFGWERETFVDAKSSIGDS